MIIMFAMHLVFFRVSKKTSEYADEFAIYFGSLFILIYSTSAISGIGQCGLEISISDLKVVSCVEHSGSNILKLLPVSQHALVNAFDKSRNK